MIAHRAANNAHGSIYQRGNEKKKTTSVAAT